MRGTTARSLRKIARELELEPKTKYAPGGRLRKRANGSPIRRPLVMLECFRKAYKEAKRMYKGLPPSALQWRPDGG